MAVVSYKDPALNKFTKSNLHYEKDPYMQFQDPTVLGFKLMFNFNQKNSGLLSWIPLENTAMGYLDSIGAKDRMHYLEKFVKTLIEINRKTPWYFQSIVGLSNAWKKGFNEENFKAKLDTDRILEIGCLESIDLRMTALMDLYRKACFDWKYKREIVPWNLRKFDFKIYIYESREINRATYDRTKKIENQKLLGEDPDPTGQTRGDNVNLINDKINRVLFDFGHCEFLPDQSGEFLEGVSNSGAEAINQKLAISYRTVSEENLYNLYSDLYVSDNADYILRDLDRGALDDPRLLDSSSTVADDLGPDEFNERARKFLQQQSKDLKDQAEQQIEARGRNFIGSQIGKAVLGNIYGFSLATIANALDNGITGLVDLAVNRTGINDSINNASNSISNPTNLGDALTPNKAGIATGNINEGGVGGESDGDSTTSLINSQEGGNLGNTNDGSSLENTPGTPNGNIHE